MWEALIHFGVDRLPVRVSSICREAGFTLRSYQAAGEFLCRNGLEEQAHSSDGFALRRCGVPLVFYNGAMVPGRIRFTIAHELDTSFLDTSAAGCPRAGTESQGWLIRRSSSRPMCLHPVCLHRPLSYMRSAHEPRSRLRWPATYPCRRPHFERAGLVCWRKGTGLKALRWSARCAGNLIHTYASVNNVSFPPGPPLRFLPQNAPAPRR